MSSAPTKDPGSRPTGASTETTTAGTPGVAPQFTSGPLAWMARNSVAANLLMAVLLVGGLVALPQIRQEVIPEFNLNVISVDAVYPGASPSEVEQGVVLALEEAVRDVEGVKEVSSTSAEGLATVKLSLLLGADADRVLSDVKNAVDRVSSFPVDVERPTIKLKSLERSLVSLVVMGDVDEHTLRTLAEQARTDLLRDPRLSSVELRLPPPREVSIEVPESRLQAHGLTLDQVARAVRQGTVEVPGGRLQTRGGEILLRTSERRNLAAEFGNVVIATRNDGTTLTLEDIAEVRDTFAEGSPSGQYDGKPALLVDINREGNQTPGQVSDALQEYIADRASTLPPGIEYRVWGDSSVAFSGRVDLLVSNAVYGLILVLLVLGAFLHIRLAFWVTLGIPISFVGGMLFFPSFEVSLNMVSLFAFIVSLGMVVDDAIVVGESVYRERQEGVPPLQAAIQGVRQVSVPVVFSVLTTVVAFMPMLFVPGTSGKFLRNVPLVVIMVLLISLVESLLILPAHLAHSKASGERGLLAAVSRVQARVTRGLDRFVSGIYKPLLERCLDRQVLTIACAFAVFIVCTVGLVAGGRVSGVFLPRIDRDQITVVAKLPVGSPRAATQAVLERLLAGCDSAAEKNGGVEGIREGVFATVGIGGDHLGTVALDMPGVEKRSLSAAEFAKAWREEVGDLPGVESITYESVSGPGSGKAIDIELSHPNMDTLREAAAELSQKLASYEGTQDVNAGLSLGKEQIDVRLRPEGRVAGLSARDIGRQLRDAFFGSEVLRQQRGRDEVRVYVRPPARERASEYNLERMLLRTPDGGTIPLTAAAELKRGRAYTTIERLDGRRLLHVTSEVDEASANANRIVGMVQRRDLPELLAKYSGLTYQLGGQQRGQRETTASLARNQLLAVFVIYAMLAVVFRSYLQPLVVMVAIPLGWTGAVVGHMIMGYSLSLISFMGMVALSGVVVNDSLVLVDAINRYRAQGMALRDAVVAGGMRRFRPILLTSLTTIFGLAPMLTETSVQARFLIPLAISLAFGLMFATFLILLVVPASYIAVESAKRRTRRAFSWLTGENDPVAPDLQPS